MENTKPITKIDIQRALLGTELSPTYDEMTFDELKEEFKYWDNKCVESSKLWNVSFRNFIHPLRTIRAERENSQALKMMFLITNKMDVIINGDEAKVRKCPHMSRISSVLLLYVSLIITIIYIAVVVSIAIFK